MLWDIWGAVWAAALLTLLGDVRATPLDPTTTSLQGVVLTPFVRHWQPANYEPARAHARRRRDAAPPSHAAPPLPLVLTFNALDREFKLVLRPDPTSVFASDAAFHSTGGDVPYDTSRVYSGHLAEDETSRVYGVITADGLFDGTITTATDEYYVEPLERYGVQHAARHAAPHSVVYRAADVLHPAAARGGDVTPCASHLLHEKRARGDTNPLFEGLEHDVSARNISRRKRWLPDDEMQDDEPKKNPDLPLDLDFPKKSPDLPLDLDVPKKNPDLPLDLDVPYSNGEPFSTRKPKTKIDRSNLITKVKLDAGDRNDRNNLITRVKSDSDDSRPKPKTHVEVIKTKAGVVTVKDIVKKEPVGYTVVSSNATDDRHVNKRATIDPNKTTCLVYLQADHMFYQRYGSEEACIEVMTRHIQKVNAIYKITDFNQDGKPDNITFMIKRIKVHTLDALKDPAYRFPNNYGVEKYLELFSEEDYDAFCLAYMFTYRDFEMGTLGLAWTGDLKNAGGVCEKNGHYRGSMKSLNTGIVTLLNYGKHVPPAVSHVTLAHEIGHNFGSPHDPEVCTPFGEDGNYIMFARATSGDRRNNNRFSPCSLRAIRPVLDAKARSAKGCFAEPQGAICGNGVVEAGEQCDCGWAGECADVCCRPQAARPTYTPCTLTEHSVCSPTQGPCCTASCTLKYGERCREDNGCRDAARCDGRRAACPPSRHKPNRTRCDKDLVCYMGECTGSICLAYGLESCQCGSRAACELCCRAPGSPRCRSSFEWNAPPYDVPDLHAKPGTPCNDYNGYCDVFQRCREVDPSGPLATLRRLLLPDGGSGLRRWLADHWYAPLAALAALALLMVLSVKLFGRRSKKLKSVTIIHSSSTEAVRLPAADHALIVHTAVRSKLPLKKKVALRSKTVRNLKEKAITAPKPVASKIQKSGPANVPDTTKVAKEASAVVTNADGKSPKHVILAKSREKMGRKRKTKLKKETIDYSCLQKHPTSPTKETEALTKVQKWLLNNPQADGVMPKSKSIPVGLSDRTQRRKAARKAQTSRSTTNLLSGEKARLQVLFKPPFKFSVKICKGDKGKPATDKTHKAEVPRRRPDPNRTELVKLAPKSKQAKTSELPLGESTPPAAVKTADVAIKTENEHAYANLLPRSSSDCKLTKNQEVRQRKSHKKSSSMSHKRETTESRQNLVFQDDEGAHVYENMMVCDDSPAARSCSMPRRRRTAEIARQNSQSDARAQLRPQKAHSTRKEHDANTHTSNSSGSSNCARTSHNRQLKRYSLAEPSAAQDGSKLRRQISETDVGKRRPGGDVRGFQLVVGKNRLRRQLSANELCQSKLQLVMPVSAGAEPKPPFCWNKRASLDCEASLAVKDNKRAYTFGELKDSAPNAMRPSDAGASHVLDT